MQSLVLNATPLIYLAKSGYIQALKQIGIPLFIPQAVYRDIVVKGKEVGKPDAELLDRFIRNEILRVVETKNKAFVSALIVESSKELKKPLHLGEAEALALAKELNSVAIMDESVGRTIGKIHDIPVHGTFYILTLAHKKGKMTKAEIKQALKEMIRVGWRLSTEDYMKVLEELEKL